MTYFASAADLVLQSDIPLPGLCPASAPASFVVSFGEVRIAAQPVEWIQNWSTDQGPPWLSSGRVDGGYVLRFTDKSDVFVDLRSRRIVCEPRGETSVETVAALVVGHVIPRVLSLDGTPVLHASAVAIAEGAIVLAGESGAGKSTLAAALCAAGGELLADDFVVLQACGAEVTCPQTSTCVNLAQMSIDLLGASSRLPRSVPHRPTVGHRARVVYLLTRDGVSRASVLRVGQRDAFIRLFRLSYRMDSIAPSRVSAEFAQLAAVAAAVPVFLLRLPRDPYQLPASVEAVLHWSRSAARS